MYNRKDVPETSVDYLYKLYLNDNLQSVSIQTYNHNSTLYSKKFPDCGATMLRNFFKLILYDHEQKQFDNNLLVTSKANDNLIEYFKIFDKDIYFRDVATIESTGKKTIYFELDDTIETAWNKVVQNIQGYDIHYRDDDLEIDGKKINHNIASGLNIKNKLPNLISVLRGLFQKNEIISGLFKENKIMREEFKFTKIFKIILNIKDDDSNEYNNDIKDDDSNEYDNDIKDNDSNEYDNDIKDNEYEIRENVSAKGYGSIYFKNSYFEFILKLSYGHYLIDNYRDLNLDEVVIEDKEIYYMYHYFNIILPNKISNQTIWLSNLNNDLFPEYLDKLDKPIYSSFFHYIISMKNSDLLRRIEIDLSKLDISILYKLDYNTLNWKEITIKKLNRGQNNLREITSIDTLTMLCEFNPKYKLLLPQKINKLFVKNFNSDKKVRIKNGRISLKKYL